MIIDDEENDVVMVLDDSDSSGNRELMHPSTSRKTSNNNSNSKSRNVYYHVSFSFQPLDGQIFNLLKTPNANPTECKNNYVNCNAITNDINNYKSRSNICKNAIKITNNIASDNFSLKHFLNSVDLDKNIYSELNPYNCKTNSKNIAKKFQQHRHNLTDFDGEMSEKEDLKYKENYEGLNMEEDLYSVSKRILNSVPGMNSMEFFETLPSSSNCKVVEIIHGIQTENEDSEDSDGDNKIKVDVDDFIVSSIETPSSSQNNEMSGKSTNETIPVSAHIQKIGRPIILNKYNELKTETIQTSFGTVIKTAQATNFLQKPTLIDTSDQLTDTQTFFSKTNTALKFINCGEGGIQQVNNNKNQTLINMLSQQLLIPANNLNNRHFIITSSKQQEPQKVVQHSPQMIQILNAPISTAKVNLTSCTTTTTTTVSAAAKSPITLTSSMGSFKGNQGIMQFICKSDGKKIHLTPICSPPSKEQQPQQTQKFITTSSTPIILNNFKKVEGQNVISIVKQEDKTRNFFEDNFAKFSSSENKIVVSKGLTSFAAIPTVTSVSSVKTTAAVIQTLPKFNQAFGKTVFSITPDEKINVKSAVPSIQQGTTTLQGSFLYARPYSFANGKLVSSTNANNVVLTTLRNKPNVRIISSIPEKNPTIMTPVRISVPLISRTNNGSDSNALQAKIIRPVIHLSGNNQPSNLRQQQFVITTAPRLNTTSTVVSPQNLKVENLLLTTTNSSNLQQSSPSKIVQQTKNVDHSTLEQLREFDMVFEQVKEKSTTTPTHTPTPVLISNNNNKSLEETNSVKKQKTVIINHNSGNSNCCSTGLSSPALSVTSVTSQSSSTSSTGTKTEPNSPQKSIVMQNCGKNRTKPTENGNKSSSNSSALKTTPKTQEDEQTAQRIYDILAEYAEQLRNSPDLNNKPAPRRRANPPTNPAAPTIKRKKIGKGMKSSEQSPDADRTSEEDSSCGMESSIGVPSTSSMNNSPRGPLDEHADLSFDSFYQDIIKKENSAENPVISIAATSLPEKSSAAKRLIFAPEPHYQIDPEDFLVSSDQPSASTSSIKTKEPPTNTSIPTATAILMPGNYLVPMNMLKSGQQLTILSNNGQKILAVPANQLSSSPLLTSSSYGSNTAPMIQRYLNSSSPTLACSSSLKSSVINQINNSINNNNSFSSTNHFNSKFRCSFSNGDGNSNKLLTKNAYLDEINSNILEKIDTDLDTSDFNDDMSSPFGNGVTCDSLFLTDDKFVNDDEDEDNKPLITFQSDEEFAQKLSDSSPDTMQNDNEIENTDSFNIDTIDDPIPKKKYKFVVRQNISSPLGTASLSDDIDE